MYVRRFNRADLAIALALTSDAVRAHGSPLTRIQTPCVPFSADSHGSSGHWYSPARKLQSIGIAGLPCEAENRTPGMR